MAKFEEEKVINALHPEKAMRRILNVLPTTLILTCILLAELAGDTNKLIYCGFLFVADVILIKGGKE